jgi:outer membrane lipoprotein SlyB
MAIQIGIISRATLRAALCGSLVASTLAFAPPSLAANRCDACGTVVTTNRKDQKGSGTAGTVVGGVGGALAGNVLGHNTTSTVLGGVGGAVAGNVIGRRMTNRKVWSVQVKMDRGDVRDIDYPTDPGFHQGDRVRITTSGRLQRI